VLRRQFESVAFMGYMSMGVQTVGGMKILNTVSGSIYFIFDIAGIFLIAVLSSSYPNSHVPFHNRERIMKFFLRSLPTSMGTLCTYWVMLLLC
jgi:hypothetical protein